MNHCTKCGDKFTREEVHELKAEHEAFSIHPFICPDCYDRLQRLNLEVQFSVLMSDDDIQEILERGGEEV